MKREKLGDLIDPIKETYDYNWKNWIRMKSKTSLILGRELKNFRLQIL